MTTEYRPYGTPWLLSLLLCIDTPPHRTSVSSESSPYQAPFFPQLPLYRPTSFDKSVLRLYSFLVSALVSEMCARGNIYHASYGATTLTIAMCHFGMVSLLAAWQALPEEVIYTQVPRSRYNIYDSRQEMYCQNVEVNVCYMLIRQIHTVLDCPVVCKRIHIHDFHVCMHTHYDLLIQMYYE